MPFTSLVPYELKSSKSRRVSLSSVLTASGETDCIRGLTACREGSARLALPRSDYHTRRCNATGATATASFTSDEITKKIGSLPEQAKATS